MEKFLAIPVQDTITSDTSVAPVGAADLTVGDPIFNENEASVGDIIVDSFGNYYLIASIIDDNNVTLTPLGAEPGEVPIASGVTFTMYSGSNSTNQLVSIDNVVAVLDLGTPGTQTTINYDVGSGSASSTADVLTIYSIPTPAFYDNHRFFVDKIQEAMETALVEPYPQVVTEISTQPYPVTSIVLA